MLRESNTKIKNFFHRFPWSKVILFDACETLNLNILPFEIRTCNMNYNSSLNYPLSLV